MIEDYADKFWRYLGGCRGCGDIFRRGRVHRDDAATA
jgi:hypothetical protein